jgi:hypothetical protein
MIISKTLAFPWNIFSIFYDHKMNLRRIHRTWFILFTYYVLTSFLIIKECKSTKQIFFFCSENHFSIIDKYSKTCTVLHSVPLNEKKRAYLTLIIKVKVTVTSFLYATFCHTTYTYKIWRQCISRQKSSVPYHW